MAELCPSRETSATTLARLEAAHPSGAEGFLTVSGPPQSTGTCRAQLPLGRIGVRFVRTKDVLRLIGVSRTTLWRMVHAGIFPQPVVISTRATGHVLEEVEAWMAARVQRSPAGGGVQSSAAGLAHDSVGPGGSGIPSLSRGRGQRRRRGRG